MTAIERYALIGDTQTAALVGDDGCIDWLCVPRFDSGACFAALLGDESTTATGGIGPASGARATRRRYRDGTLVLETEWDTPEGTVRLIDCMPVRDQHIDVVRIVEGRERPRADDDGPHRPLRLRQHRPVGARGRRRRDPLRRRTRTRCACARRCASRATTSATPPSSSVAAGDRVPFVLTGYPSYRTAARGARRRRPRSSAPTAFWQEWIGRARTYDGEWSDARAALVDHAQGAHLRADRRHRGRAHHLAARVDRRRAQLGLPLLLAARRDVHDLLADERRATRTRRAPSATGCCARWPAIPRTCRSCTASPASGASSEYEVDWLPGYEGSAPVRVGNAAHRQFQLDVYGEVLDSMHQARAHGHRRGPERVGRAAGHPRVPRVGLDASPTRGSGRCAAAAQDFVHSKVMAWVAFDRAVKGVEEFGLDGPVDRWRTCRDDDPPRGAASEGSTPSATPSRSTTARQASTPAR